MKKFSYLIPVLIIVVSFVLGQRASSSANFSPLTSTLIMIAILAVLMLFRPKKPADKPIGDVEVQVRGEYAKDAFKDNDQLNAKFQAALKDYSKSMPKAAINKLTKLAPLCRNDQETYAVASATGLCCIAANRHKDAIPYYTRALGLHPTSEMAQSLGSCQQRMGRLDEAMDSYEFALDLDASNITAKSALATAYVADGDYDTALDYALKVLETDEKNASAMATAAICYGLDDDTLMHKHYTKLAVENGYDEKKIKDTVTALKKRDK